MSRDCWLHIAVLAEEHITFERFIEKLPIEWEFRTAGSRAIGGGVQYTRVSRSTDVRGCEFSGIVYLDELGVELERDLQRTIRFLKLKPEAVTA